MKRYRREEIRSILLRHGGRRHGGRRHGYLRCMGGRSGGWFDALDVIPLVDLFSPLEETLRRMSLGLLPDSYGWTEEKTRRAYTYKSYAGWAKSIVVAAKYYFTDEQYPEDEGFGRFARFTWRNNYGYIRQRLTELMNLLSSELEVPVRHKILSNYTSSPEKPLVRFSGLADVGRHTVLIHERMGPYFTIGEAFTDLELEPDGSTIPHAPAFPLCGSCRACVDACPTGAILEGGKIDVNRCLQYLSERFILMPPSTREKWENRLYGCTTCIDVCPYSGDLEPTAEKHGTGFIGTGMPLLEALSIRERDWPGVFSGNQIGIRSYGSFVKNAITACGSLRFKEAYDRLLPFTEHASEILRAYACWAVGRLPGRAPRTKLQEIYRRERSPRVKEEIKAFL
jgi:epoxyqueuosine reductase